MDRVKKILSSPITRKKVLTPSAPPGHAGSTSQTGPSTSASKYIGLPLEEIVKRENVIIPNLVTKVCAYIYSHGLDAEGIFRVSGNSRIVDKLRVSFDRTGGADFDEAADIMAVAGLLKMFLRELPDAIIPTDLTRMFVSVQEDYAKDMDGCLRKLKALLSQLGPPNYDTLKYICQFLIIVAGKENVNKMSPMALGIVFGPNIFRCSGGVQGLKEQGITNHITLKFITCYNRLFLEDGELSPSHPSFLLPSGSHVPTVQMANGKRKAPPPPRPPPLRAESHSSPPVPSPRKQKNKTSGRLLLPPSLDDLDLDNRSDLGSLSNTPQPSDEEYLEHRALSPFALDSERSEYSAAPSPRVSAPAATNQLVEKVIASSIMEHLFGDSASGHSSDDSLGPYQRGTPVAAPRRKRNQKDSAQLFSKDTGPAEVERRQSVKDRISHFEDDEEDAQVLEKKVRQRPKSKAFELFEDQGIIIGPAPPDLAAALKAQRTPDDFMEEEPIPVPRPRSPPKRPASPVKATPDLPDTPMIAMVTDDNLHQPAHSTLNAFKRAPGPKRRTPSRPKRSSSELTMEITDDSGPPKPRLFLPDNQSHEDVNHNPTKRSMRFLNQHPLDDSSPDKSPTGARKPYVPPLDLSILHTHVDGSVPISVSLQKASQYSEDEAAVLSPRMSKLKQQKNAHPDTDVPPSPPTDQTHLTSKRIDDENTIQVKQLTKKIQSCKKKIKSFEETFDQEHGYKPSQTDKIARPDVKRSMQELARARKELRRIKEDMEHDRRASASSPSGLAVLPNGRTGLENDSPHSADRPPTMEETLQLQLRKLAEKRQEFDRPEDLSIMTRDQTLEEKLSVQKALLHFESIHGRPTTKAEKELMRPLYDRYRNIKRILTKPPSPRDKAKELQSVPEDQAIEFSPTGDTACSTEKEPVRVPTSSQDDTEDSEDFLITKDFRLLKTAVNSAITPLPVASSQADLSPDLACEHNLHELSIAELLEEQQRYKQDKKRLRKVLRDFEDDFTRQSGRKVIKEDRAPMETEYHEYKQVKARLKLLDALLSKYDPLSVY